jgi:hypothetical protein
MCIRQRTEVRILARKDKMKSAQLALSLALAAGVAAISPLPLRAEALPDGTLDLIDKTVVYGWSADPDVPSQSNVVRFFVDGPYGQGQLAGQVVADIVRDDVNRALHITGRHGFQWLIPLPFRDGKAHLLYAYGMDASALGRYQLLYSSPKEFVVPPLPVISSKQEPYTIGAWYFTAWSSLNDYQAVNSERAYGRHDAWGGVRDYARGADPWGLYTDYSDREPLLGFYDLLNQDVMDAHIRQAASSGLSFFAFYWYWDTDKNREANVAIPIRTFLSSPLKNSMKFLIAPIKAGGAPMTRTMWRDSVVPFIVDHYLADSSYLTTQDGRPVVILFDPGFPTKADAIAGIAALRSQVKARLQKDPLLLLLYQGQSLDRIYFPNEPDTDGFATFQWGPNRPAEPYAETTAHWKAFIIGQRGFFHIPGVSTGFDTRPWWKVGWVESTVPNDTNYNTEISLTAFRDHLIDARSYLDRYPEETSRTLIVYAWNEWGEGGIIEPSRTKGYQALDTLKEVFGLSARLPR